MQGTGEERVHTAQEPGGITQKHTQPWEEHTAKNPTTPIALSFL